MLIFIVACYLLLFHWLLCLLMKVKSQNGRGSDSYNPESGGFTVDEYVWSGSHSYLGGIGLHPLVMRFGDMSCILRLWQPGLRTLVWLSARTIQFGSHNGPGHFIWLVCYFSQLDPKYAPKQSNWDHHGWETVFECSLAYHLWIKLMCNVWGNTSRTQRELWHTPVDIHICTLNYPAKIVGAPKSSTRWYQRPHPQAWLAIWKHLSNLWVAEFFCGGIHSPSM